MCYGLRGAVALGENFFKGAGRSLFGILGVRSLIESNFIKLYAKENAMVADKNKYGNGITFIGHAIEFSNRLRYILLGAFPHFLIILLT